MNFAELKAMDEACVASTYARYSIDIAKGKNATCWDESGKKMIDFTSGIGVNILGFCNAGWTDTVKNQLDYFAHTSNLFYTKPCATLAKKLCELSGCQKVFFGNSGAEANEAAIKVARKYSADRYEASRAEIVTLVNSFHGRTITTLSATGQAVFHEKFNPLTPGFSYASAGDMADLQEKVNEKTCAVMFELIQGEGGVVALDEDYVRQVEAFCKSRDILLIVDEVQTGVGRTGKFLCSEYYGINPDIVSLAKGLGGGLPIGAALFFGETASVLGAGDHGSTFGGNPVSCAGANYILDHFTAEFLEEVNKKAEYIRKRLSEIPKIESLSGKGLMIGITVKNGNSKELARNCAANGLLILTAKEKLRMLPPLSIQKEEIDEGISILTKVLN